MTCLVGRALDSKAGPGWLWKGRRVLMFDGATVSMPDTSENHAEYPQPSNQRPGLDFLLARIGAITSLATGATLDLGFSRYAGKGRGEVTLLRGLSGVFRAGDVLLVDCLIGNWRRLYEQLLDVIALRRVAGRPDRFEPRRHKRRPPLYGYLHLPRNQARIAMLRGAKRN